MHIPVRFGLVGPNGEDLAFSRRQRRRGSRATSSTSPRPSQTIVFHGVSTPAGAVAAPRLLGAGEARRSISPPDDLLFLLRTDADPFNRWQAAQTLANARR